VANAPADDRAVDACVGGSAAARRADERSGYSDARSAWRRSLLEFAGAVVLVSHDRYMLDRVSTIVIGLDGGEGGVFADYSQWEESRNEPVAEKPLVKEAREPSILDGPKKKLSYMEQREWDGAEAEDFGSGRRTGRLERELEAAGSDVKRYTAAYEKVQAAQRRVEDLYTRWGGVGGEGREVRTELNG